MLEVEAVDGLHTALLDVASNPARIEGLHHILGDFCHLFRNKLNCLKLSLYLSKRSAPPDDVETWTELERTYREAEQFLEIIQLIYRPMPLDLIQFDLGMFIEDFCESWRKRQPGRMPHLVPPRGAAIGSFDPGRLAKGFDALFHWRSAVSDAPSSARLHWWIHDEHFHVEWADEGPYGLDDESLAAARGEVLALPLLIRIITAHHGTVSVARANGLELTMRWPLDPHSQ